MAHTKTLTTIQSIKRIKTLISQVKIFNHRQTMSEKISQNPTENSSKRRSRDSHASSYGLFLWNINFFIYCLLLIGLSELIMNFKLVNSPNLVCILTLNFYRASNSSCDYALDSLCVLMP